MKILIASPIDVDAVRRLKAQHDVVSAIDVASDGLAERVRDREVLIFRSGLSITSELMACAPDLKLLIRAGSGTDNLDLAYVRQNGLELVRIPEPGAKAVAEMSFGLMLALSRGLMEADRALRQGRWLKHHITGHLLANKTLGIVGVGNIGSRVGQLSVAWGMAVMGCVEHFSSQRVAEFEAKGIRLTDFDEVISNSDYVSIHVPLKESTRNLIDASALGRIKPGAFLINLARGGIVDEQALRRALVEGRLRGAALDVHCAEGDGKISPLADLPNVILTPHIGASTVDTQLEIGRRVVEAVSSFAAGSIAPVKPMQAVIESRSQRIAG
jgi:phosphoglycerate dehydrogenase-like enzyme